MLFQMRGEERGLCERSGPAMPSLAMAPRFGSLPLSQQGADDAQGRPVEPDQGHPPAVARRPVSAACGGNCEQREERRAGS